MKISGSSSDKGSEKISPMSVYPAPQVCYPDVSSQFNTKQYVKHK